MSDTSANCPADINYAAFQADHDYHEPPGNKRLDCILSTRSLLFYQGESYPKAHTCLSSFIYTAVSRFRTSLFHSFYDNS